MHVDYLQWNKVLLLLLMYVVDVNTIFQRLNARDLESLFLTVEIYILICQRFLYSLRL